VNNPGKCSEKEHSIIWSRANYSASSEHGRKTMADVRLKQNLIIDGKFYVRGSLVDEKLVPPKFCTETYVENLQTRDKVLLLRDLSFMSVPRAGSDGIATSFPVHLAAGELLDLSQVPASKRESLIEGLDYREAWTFEEAEALRKAQEDVYQPLETEPVVSPTGYR
jgi:hypothetical protein